MAAQTKSKVTPKYKTKYRVKNWAAYEEFLRKRGDITVWFDEGAINGWNAPPSGRPGGQAPPQAQAAPGYRQRWSHRRLRAHEQLRP